MISGRVVSIGRIRGHEVLEPRVSIDITASNGGVLRSVDCAIDTGFTDWLIMPTSTIRGLGLQYQGQRRLRLANGRPQMVKLFTGFIAWHGQILTTLVHEMNSRPLLGMGLLTGSLLTVENIAGGNVTIEEMTTES